ncbi:MAG: hypothetical protein M3362_03490 [Acidobacteriota bacterium]|nr:hypothetical protein [Acidobacteriota bacterium]
MSFADKSFTSKLRHSLPWLARYPFWRARSALRGFDESDGARHLILIVANHFEPSWNESGELFDLSTQLSRLDRWCEKAMKIGEAVRDVDGTPFRHTNFYPAEQYDRRILEKMAALQSEGYGEVEVHLHHGVERPDDAANTRRVLTEFRDLLAEEHQCLSREEGGAGETRYAFVHGNWALANSSGGLYCGVDSEMRILAETGCYADFTLPSAPDRSQVPRLNAIYECGGDIDRARPHASGRSLRVGDVPSQAPVIFTGPLVFDWSRRRRGLPFPRIDNSALTANYPLTPERVRRWAHARIHVGGRPEWVFIKLYCHGFFDFDQEAVIGETMRRGLEETIEYGERTGEFKLHFACAREAFNIAVAAVDGKSGEPGLFRDYRLRPIMAHATAQATGTRG